MTAAFIVTVTFALCMAIHILRAIQKNVTTQLAFTRYEKSLMDYLRSKDPKLTVADYNKLSEMIGITDNLMKMHLKRPSSVVHSMFFMSMIRSLVKAAYNYEERLKNVYSTNKDVVRLKANLDELIMWSVFYNTPFIVKLSVLGNLIFQLICRLVSKGTSEQINTAEKWFDRVIISYSKQDFCRRLNLTTTFLHLHNS